MADVWIANKYINAEPGDSGLSRIPTLKTKTLNEQHTIANTNKDKSLLLAKTFFLPPPALSTVPTDFPYPEALPNPGYITETQLLRAITKLSPYKAPGPDGIPNAVFKNCSDVLTPHLLWIYNAVFLLNTYHPPWREFNTVVLRKPGKPDYSTPKAYRPITLLNTTAKLLTSIVADHMSHLIETNNLLPATHFGRRPGRSTTDSLHLLEATVKNAWCTRKTVSVLFLDIEGTFPNAVTNRLIHNMRKRRIPESLILFTKRVLTDRKTRLIFDGHTSSWIPITNGIGQGDPLSMVVYIIYNADLIEVSQGHPNKLTLAFVDDTAFITIGETINEIHNMLHEMLERAGGGFKWSRNHNSKFETNKFALIDFTRTIQKDEEHLPMDIRGTIIKPTPTHKFLGVIIDERLSWRQHIAYAIGKGTAYTLQLRRLTIASKGLPLSLM
jgi:hypothetical protein